MKRWKQFLWSDSDKNGHLTVDGPILGRKAEEMATKLNIEFKPSNGWIDRFKKHSGLVYRKVCGEANSVNPEGVVAWKDTILLHLMAKYSPKDIICADEFGLFYSMLPDKTYTFKGASCKGIKVNKKKDHHSCMYELGFHREISTPCNRKIKTATMCQEHKAFAMHLPSQQDCLDDV
jgi:hypothetical protein